MEKVRYWPVFILFSFVFGGVGGFLGARFAEPEIPSKIDNKQIVENKSYIEESEIITAIEKISPSVVSVVAFQDLPLTPFYDPSHDRRYILGYEPQEVAGGTGFIVTADGLILTNRHVVESDTSDYKVILSDGIEFSAEIVSKDPFDDVAVLRIISEEKLDLPVVSFGDSDDLKVGQKVFAVGNALAVYGNTVTAGIISAKGREVAAYDEFGENPENLFGLIQTDAAINLGNSGGPLVNLVGEVIGMNVATADEGDAIGFAIPVNDLKPVLKSIEQYGEIIRPVLGVRFIMINAKEAEELQIDTDHGALLISGEYSDEPAITSGGAGEEAGLKEFDVILEVEGVVLDFDNPLQRVIRNYNPGDKVELTVLRDGKEITIDVTLKSSKDLEA